MIHKLFKKIDTEVAPMGLKDTIFIQLLELGVEKGIEGITVLQARDWLRDSFYEGRSLDISTKHNFDALFFECFANPSRTSGEPLCALKTEYAMRLIDFHELQEARVNAKSAKKSSTVAIAMSLVAVLLSGYLGHLQLTKETTVEASQINGLVAAINQRQYDESIAKITDDLGGITEGIAKNTFELVNLKKQLTISLESLKAPSNSTIKVVSGK